MNQQVWINNLANRIVRHENTQGEPYCWHGKPEGSEVITRYPNLVAAIAYSRLWLSNVAQSAGVSKDVLEAVINDGEELSYDELYEATRWCNRIGCPKELYYRVDFIMSPTLSLMDPTTNKYLYRLRQLEEWTDKCDREHLAYHPDTIEDARGVIARMHEKQAIPYAAYREALERVMESCIAHERELERRATRRTTRRTPGSYEPAAHKQKEKYPWENIPRDEAMKGILEMLPDAETHFLQAMDGLLKSSHGTVKKSVVGKHTKRNEAGSRG